LTNGPDSPLFVLCEAAVFLVGALVHFGVLTHGYEHRNAGIAEIVLGTVLMLGLLWMWLRPALTRTVGLAVQMVVPWQSLDEDERNLHLV
jgi:hypothetical protein